MSFIEKKLEEYKEKFVKVGNFGDKPIPPMTAWQWFERTLKEQQEAILGCLPEERRPQWDGDICRSCGYSGDSRICDCQETNDFRDTFLQNLREVVDKSDE
jgi:hypothetical protein